MSPFHKALCGISILVLALSAGVATAGEQVVLRTAGGHFLGLARDGSLYAAVLYPSQDEVFELERLENDRIALKAPGGRFLAAAGPGDRLLCAGSKGPTPQADERFELVGAEDGRLALRGDSTRQFILFDPKAGKTTGKSDPEKPTPGETVEIYHFGEIPVPLRSALTDTIRSIAEEELRDKRYDKTRSRLKEKAVNLPAPTLREPGRTKQRRVFAYREEYRVTAELDGPLSIGIRRMPYLKSEADDGGRLMMFVADVTVPARGSVRYDVGDHISISTGYRATAQLTLIGEVHFAKSGDELSFDSPKLRYLRVQMELKHLSNDLLDALRSQVERILNHELRDRQDHIRQKANQSLAKAVKSRQFRHPLLRYLAL